MSDIPIGSPPVPPGRHAAPSGWYPDPLDRSHERYWDGWQWGRDTRPAAGGRATGAAGPVPTPAAPAAPGWAGYGAGGYAGADSSRVPPTGTGAAMSASGKATTTDDGVPLAGWGWRAIAAILDYVFVSFLTAIPATPILRTATQRMTEIFQRTMEAAQNNQPPPTIGPYDLMSANDQLALSALTLAVGIGYHLLFLRLARATPGKLIVGLRVVPFGQGGFAGPLPWRLAVVRSVAWMVPQVAGLAIILLLVDCVTPLFQRHRQALHDLVARSQVVRPGRAALAAARAARSR